MANKISSLDRLANVISDFAAWFHYDFLGLEDYMPIFEKLESGLCLEQPYVSKARGAVRILERVGDLRQTRLL